jgi:hypothetical protein
MFASRSTRDLASQGSASPPRSHKKGEPLIAKREINSYGGAPARKGPRPSFIENERVHRKKPSISFADLEYDDKFKTIAHRKQGKTITVLGQYVRVSLSPPPHNFLSSHFLDHLFSFAPRVIPSSCNPLP